MEFDHFPIFLGMSGQVEWKSESLKLCPRPFLSEALCPKWSFTECSGNGLNGL
jgi:hypothetical protein